MNDSLKMYLFHYWMNQRPWTNLLYVSKTNNVIDKSSFEVSNYFQKEIYSILIATVHIRVYSWTINFYNSASVIWMFVTEIMILCGWKDCEAVSFQTDDSCSLQVSGSANADFNVQITLMCTLQGRTKWSQHCDRTCQRLRNETDESF